MRLSADLGRSPISASVMNFGAMTCTESCVATLLNLMGCDYRYFFLDYWNLFYEAGVLLAGRNLDSVDLDFLYGIGKERRTELKLEECARLAADPACSVLLLTRASKLPFFPKKLLAFEENGFDHYVLVHGYDSSEQALMAVDPIAGFSGAVPLDELRDASPYGTGFRAWILTRKPYFRPPAPAELFSYVGIRNYRRSVLSQRAYRAVLDDLDRLAGSSSAEQARWIEQNNIAITSVVKNRRLVWRGFAELDLLSDGQKIRWDKAVQSVIAEWTRLNLLLLKWTHAQRDDAMRLSIRDKLKGIEASEKRLLFAMATEGRR
jgi:hypothetical protein